MKLFPAAVLFFLLTFLLSGMLPAAVRAEGEDTADSENYSYGVYIDDAADLFTDEEEQELFTEMDPLAGYSDFILHTTNEDSFDSTEEYAKDYFDSQLGAGSNGIVFIIDMAKRELYIRADGAAARVITPYQATLITDNIYRMAHDGDYFGTVKEGAAECLKLWNGEKVTAPMRIISTALISAAEALLIVLLIVILASSSKKAALEDIIKNTRSKHEFRNIRMVKTDTTRVYNPQTSDSDGGGGGGGGDSGGGGGHGF